jgi:prepilin-type N-terminal cleavage/methylation domain-containing protein
MRRGFTLVELLVSMAVIAVLAVLLFPAVQAARAASRDAECRSNLHDFGIDINARMGPREEIPNFADHRVVPNCPACDDNGINLCWYDEIWHGERRTRIIEEYGVPSERIVAVRDVGGHHGGHCFALFLDGHVALLDENSVGYDPSY